MSEVEIYASMWCGFCQRAKTLLAAKGVEFTEIDVDATAGARDEMAARSGGQRTVPQIFIDGQHIGGSDDLAMLEFDGKLDRMLGRDR